MLFYTTFARRTFTVSLNELFENYTGRHTHVYSGRMTRLKYPPWFFDNYFISFRLLKHIEDHCYIIIKKGIPIIKPEILQKLSRGHRQIIVTIVDWNENKAVYICSNNISASPLSNVRRL